MGADPAPALFRRPADGVGLASAAAACAFLVPARFVIPALGAAATPAVIAGLGALAWWVRGRLRPSPALATGPQPVRTAAFFLAAAWGASYAAAWTAALTGIEARNADRTLIVLASLLGLLLVTADAAPSVERVTVLLRRVVALAALSAAIGAAQFFSRVDLSGALAPLGLVERPSPFPLNLDRSGFRRAVGAGQHPIEFAVVCGVLLPLALHLALTDSTRGAVRRWTPPALLAGAVPLGVSRAGVVAAVVGVAVAAPSLTARGRRLAAGLAGLAGLALLVAAPGLLGTLRSYFLLEPDTDPSLAGRRSDLAVVDELTRAAPILGQGPGVYTPAQPGNAFLDNQYFLTAVETGVVGVAALAAFLLAGAAAAIGARRAAVPAEARRLAGALTGSIAAQAVTFAAYDALTFRQASVVLFLTVGAAGALRRVATAPAQAQVLAG